jgi:hypothetical protein
MTTFLWLLPATASTVIGDYGIKRSTALPQGMGSAQFALAALCYGAARLCVVCDDARA